MTTVKSARKISTSSIYCAQLERSLENLESNNAATNYVLAYTFLILTTETYLSGLFPLLLKWLSGKGKHTEIISTKKANRKTLSLDKNDLLEGWYSGGTANQSLLKPDIKGWSKAQIPVFFEKIGTTLSKDKNNDLYDKFYFPLFEIRNTLFHRDELISGNFGQDSFIDLYFHRKKLDEMINSARSLIDEVHSMIDEFIRTTDFEAKSKRPFAMASAKAFKEPYENHQRSIRFLLGFNSKNTHV